MGTLLRVLVSKNLKDWDIKLAHAEFAYNRVPSTTTGKSPFEVVYGINPLTPIDLTSLPLEIVNVEAKDQVAEMKKLHERIRVQIERANNVYKTRSSKHRRQVVFQPGDLVWLHLRKERFPNQRKSKLAPRADGPFEVLSRVGDGAYKIDLPSEYGNVSATFNVGDLSPYVEEIDHADLRSNPSQPREDDEIQGHTSVMHSAKGEMGGDSATIIDDCDFETLGGECVQDKDFWDPFAISGKVDFSGQPSISGKKSQSQLVPCHPPTHCLGGSSIGLSVLMWLGVDRNIKGVDPLTEP